VRYGIWGCVADGVVWRSMRHISGRQPPHARDRSERLKRERSDALRAAEGLGDVVGRLSREEPVLPGEVRASGYSAAVLLAAAKELNAAGRR
jgi:hypothetical protein